MNACQTLDSVPPSQLTRQGLWRHHGFLLLCNNNRGSVFIFPRQHFGVFFLSFLNLLYKQLCLWFKCTTLRDSNKVLITKICQNSPTSPGNTLLPPALEKRNKKKKHYGDEVGPPLLNECRPRHENIYPPQARAKSQVFFSFFFFF